MQPPTFVPFHLLQPWPQRAQPTSAPLSRRASPPAGARRRSPPLVASAPDSGFFVELEATQPHLMGRPDALRHHLAARAARLARQGSRSRLSGLFSRYLPGDYPAQVPAYLAALSAADPQLADELCGASDGRLLDTTQAEHLRRPSGETLLDAPLAETLLTWLWDLSTSGAAAMVVGGLQQVVRANWPIPRDVALARAFGGAIHSGNLEALQALFDYVAADPHNWRDACDGNLWRALLNEAVQAGQARAYAALALDCAKLCPAAAAAHRQVQDACRRTAAGTGGTGAVERARQAVAWGDFLASGHFVLRDDPFRQLANAFLRACRDDDVARLTHATADLPYRLIVAFPLPQRSDELSDLLRDALQAAVDRGNRAAAAYLIEAPWWGPCLDVTFRRQVAEKAELFGQPPELVELLRG